MRSSTKYAKPIAMPNSLASTVDNMYQVKNWDDS